MLVSLHGTDGEEDQGKREGAAGKRQTEARE
jgi:hypothetical protein